MSLALGQTAPIPLMRLVAKQVLRPHEDMHPSWLPAEWPLAHRRWQGLGPGGRMALAQWHRARFGVFEGPFDTPCRRLLLWDSASLRRLAIYLGLVLHGPLMQQRGALAGVLRRQFHRIDPQAWDLVTRRLPALTRLQADVRRLGSRPGAAGRAVVDRGYRLLQAAVEVEGVVALAQLRCKLPRRVSNLRPLILADSQKSQLDEVMFMGIVPERLPQWDWLT